MASLIGNKKNTKQKYDNSEAGMLSDAKLYAKKDFNQSLLLIEKLGATFTEEQIAKALISVKHEFIINARTKRVSYFD